MTTPAQPNATDPAAAPAPGGEPAATPPTATPQPAANVPKTFTQEEVNRIAANAREEGRKSVQRTAPTPTGTAPEGTGDDKLSLKALQGQLAQLSEQLTAERERAAFDRDAASLRIAPEQADDLYDLYRVQKPGDRRGWLLEKSARWGFASAPANTGAPTASPPAAPAVAAPNAPASPAIPPQPQNALPASNRGAPPPAQPALEEMDIVHMAESDRQALIKQKGMKWYRDKLNSQLKGRTIRLRA